MIISDRYKRNIGTFTQEEFKKIKKSNICIVGCGGLGGYCANSFIRFGVNKITLVDGDIFNLSNLNRQLFSSEDNLNKNKAVEIAKILNKINPEVEVVVYEENIDLDNGENILLNQDIVLDCLDNISSRILLSKLCSKMGIFLVHGAVEEWYGQVANIFPNDGLMEKIYFDKNNILERDNISVPSFLPQLISSIQVSEGLKYLSGKEGLLRNELLYIDLLYNEFSVIPYDD